jgi:hypothetical protein
MDKGKRVLHWGPWQKVFNVLQTGPQFTIHLSLWLCRKPPRVLRNWTHDPSPNGIVTAAKEKGGGAYRRRGCSGEGSGEIRVSLAITSRYGSSAMVVGVGQSTCAGGGARLRWGIWPAHDAIIQSNGSGSFTRDQGRYAREQFENGSPDCSVYARPRATEVRRGRSWVSGEVLPGPRTWKASWATGEANRVAGTAWKWLGGAGRGGRGSGGDGRWGRARRSWSSCSGREAEWRADRCAPEVLIGALGHGWELARGTEADHARRARTGQPVRGRVLEHTIEHVEVWFCPSSNARWPTKTCISCQGTCVASLHRSKVFLSCVSPKWRYRLGEKIWWPEDCSISTAQTETKPVSSHVKRFGFDLKHFQSVPRVFWRHFDIWTSRIWVLENREHIWTLGRVWYSIFWISEFFP